MSEWGTYLSAMRAKAPLVQNITNYVSMNVMANVLLASGCSPAMVHAEEEAAEFAGFASALTINIGTLSTPWVASMLSAANAANKVGTPWILDPVAAGATGFRRETAAKLLSLKPSVIRGNASEIMALSGMVATGKGVDSADSVEAAKEAAKALALSQGAVVAVTGEEDFVTDGETSYLIANGHSMMPQVTALGCSLTGVVAAFVVDQPHLEATTAAIAYYGLAGERVAATTKGPGSFAAAFLDALYQIDEAVLTDGAKVRLV